MNFIMIGLLLREALDRLRVHLNMYLVENAFTACPAAVCPPFKHSHILAEIALQRHDVEGTVGFIEVGVHCTVPTSKGQAFF